MRIFFSGDEDVCKRHLPVVQARANEFAKLTEKRGLKQNAFTYSFDDTGAVVRGAYVFGQLSVSIDAPVRLSSGQKKETIIEVKSPEWIYVYPLECTGGGLGAFFSVNTLLIPRYKDGFDFVYSDFVYADDTPWFDSYTMSHSSSADLRNVNGFLFIRGVSKSISHVATLLNGTLYGAVTAYNFDKVRSNVWFDGYSPSPAVMLSADTMYFVTGGDYADTTVPEVVRSAIRPSGRDIKVYGSGSSHASVLWKGEFPFPAYNDPPPKSGFLGVGQEPGSMGVGVARGDNITVHLEGSQSMAGFEKAGEGAFIYHRYYYTLYQYTLFVKVFDGETLHSFEAQLLDVNVGQSSSFFNVFQGLDEYDNSKYSATTIATNVRCAPRNTGFITGFLRSPHLTTEMGPQKLMSPSMYDGAPPTGGEGGIVPNSNFVKVEFNFFTVQNGTFYTGLVDVDIFISYISRWNYDGTAFLYIDVTYEHTYGNFTQLGSYTIYGLELSGGLTLVPLLTISGVSNPAYIWYSKNWETIVIKGSTSEDGIYRRESGSYAKIQDGFTDVEPVYISHDGDTVITQQKIYRKNLPTIECVHCVGIFFDNEHYVDRISDSQYAIKNMIGEIITTTPLGLYNYHELSEDGSFAVFSKYYTDPAVDNTSSEEALIADFVDGPIKFEKTDKVFTQQLSANPILGERYLTGSEYEGYVAPPWCHDFYASIAKNITRIRRKRVVTTYIDTFELREKDSPPTKRIVKHFWHHAFGVFERVLDTLTPIPESMLYQQIRTTTETEE